MIRRIFYLFLLPLFVYGDTEPFSLGNDDPAIVHHVNVITGHLNLSFSDIVAEGVVPISLGRTYSSGVALQPIREEFLLKFARGGWLVQGGWHFLAHTNLLVTPGFKREEYKAYLAEPNGNMVGYEYSHRDPAEKHVIFLKPIRKISKAGGQLSSRTSSHNNLLRINQKKGEAQVVLPDGGYRIYRGRALYNHEPGDSLGRYFYLLAVEVLPSKQQFRYFYDKQTNLERIESQNPSGEKVYAAIDFEYIAGSKSRATYLTAKTTDGKEIQYLSGHHKEIEYLKATKTANRPKEYATFKRTRKRIGARLLAFSLEGREQFKVSYHKPCNKEEKDSEGFAADKVEAIYEPVGANGEDIKIAYFTYNKNLTSVRDHNGILVEYHHDGEKLTEIVYFNEKEEPHAIQRFYWVGPHLYCKTLFNSDNEPLFAKTFTYEEENVVEEVFWGEITGENKALLEIDSNGNPRGECYRKRYSYYTDNYNLLKTEWEEEGPLYQYFYKPDTDLLSAKFTKNHKGEVLARLFNFYDEDNLLIHEIVDNGCSLEVNDLTGVTQRLQKQIERNELSGLPETIIESYLDPVAKVQRLLKKTKLTYNNNKVVEEAVYDAEDLYRYTIYTEYDAFGNVKRKTTPIGQENTYEYNELGLLTYAKEVGAPKKSYLYDKSNRLLSCTEVDTGKTIATTYDPKGHVLSQTDPYGNTTHYAYDAFGNRISMVFPKGEEAAFQYNIQGDLTVSKMPLGETTKTSYNALHKPTYILQPDGSEVQHFYYKNGLIAKTVYSDGTEDRYVYDALQQMISKATYSSSFEVLSSETWEYDSFQMRSYTDPRGLVTRFFYDGAGRKVQEERGGRITSFTYNVFGLPETVDNGAVTVVKKQNVLGLLEEEWQQDVSGKVENRMRFFYDEENQKKEAIRITSQGEARDFFDYKEGRLVRHTDPNGAVTKFIYAEDSCLRKTVIDPLGNQTIETYDEGQRLISQEKKDPKGSTVFKEEFFYDLSGNQTKRISYVYIEGSICREIVVSWKYDLMGRVIAEMEGDDKITIFCYDVRGRLRETTTPRGVKIYSTYDGISRLVSQKSSDGLIDEEYIYSNGPEAIAIVDHVQKSRIKRSYNKFGELTHEVNANEIEMRWQYDNLGRCTSTILPDGSSIDFCYAGSHMRDVKRKSKDGKLLYQHNYTEFDPNGHVSKERAIFDLGVVATGHDLLERPYKQTSPHLEQSITYGLSGLVTSSKNSLFGEKEYAYDALNQLTKEGKKNYHFDSLGNPATCEVNHLNQITATEEYKLRYDQDGNLTEKRSPDQQILYTFDPRGRLTQIIYPKEKKITYSYDPLSRLLSKTIYYWGHTDWKKEKTLSYLYDQGVEIGTLDENGQITELRVLGLGLRGDIGAAIAIEVEGSVYAPLHDFFGNVIGLVSSRGMLVEVYEIDAFGKEKHYNYPTNPWRFSSKRSEEGLVFFGFRFYDPSLGRWISPDPTGFADGSNLYLYVHNSPLNRLDLFGLASEFINPLAPPVCYVPITTLPPDNRLLQVVASIGGVPVDFAISCGHWNELKFSARELEANKFNLFDHFPEVISSGGKIDLVTYRHGIDTTFSIFNGGCESIAKQIPGTLMIGLYHGTKGVGPDVLRTLKDLCNIETFEVAVTRQFLLACSKALYKINPAVTDSSGVIKSLGSIWMHINHSRGGVIDFRAIQGMASEEKQILQTQILITAVAPAHTLPIDFGLKVVNYYSTQDFITGAFGDLEKSFSLLGRIIGGLFSPKAAGIGGTVGALTAQCFFNQKDCDIKFVPCLSKWEERTMGADHAFLGTTYREVVSGALKESELSYGFYNAKTR
jgi:RHS repeat-associated protein